MAAEILIVDNDPDHLELSVLALQDACAPGAIATAGSGRETLAYLAACPPDGLPRAVVLDVNLGTESGLDVLRAIRADARLARLPVVMHSSSRDQRDVAQSYEAGANSYVVKRSDFAGLQSALVGVYQTWRQPVPPVPTARPE